MNIKGFYTANQIIDEALAGVRDFDRKYYDEAAMYFLRGYRDFQLFDAGGEVKETWKPVSSVNTVEFPHDLLRLIDIGIVHRGEFFSFTRKDDIVGISNPIDAGYDSTRGEDDTLKIVPTWGYGTKGHNVEYYFKEERDLRRIRLSRMAVDATIFSDRSEVLVRYVSTGIENFDTTYIASDAANLLISYIEYKLVWSRPDKYDRGYRFDKKNEYIENERMYATLELPSLQELEDIIYETSSQNIRRL